MTGITNAAGYQAKFDRVLELRERGPFPDLGSPRFLAVAFCLRIGWHRSLPRGAEFAQRCLIDAPTLLARGLYIVGWWKLRRWQSLTEP